MSDAGIGELLARYRKMNDMTQKELAERLFVSPDLVSKWERGSRRPDSGMIISIADVFGVSPEEFESSGDKVTSGLSGYVPENTDSETLKDLINGFLREIPERDRNVFLLRFYYFYDMKTIGDTLGISPGNAGVILHRTKAKLKKYIKRKLDQ